MFRNHKIVVVLLVLLVVLAMAFTSTAQDNIAYGDVIEGTASGEDLNYTFSAEAGEVIALALQSDEFDPYLTLLDPSGDEAAFNDDSIGLNSQIGYSAAETGDYTIVVSAFGGNPEGAFTLTVLGGTCLLFEDTAAGSVVEYDWTIPEGNVVTIDLSSEDFDTYITLNDSEDEEIDTNDDGGEGLNSLLSFISPADDTYSITVGQFLSDTPEGDYTLILSGQAIIEVIEDTVSETTEYTTFDGVAGQTVTISLNSEDFDTLVRVLDANGVEVATNDDGGDSLNSLLNFTPTEDGEYTVVVDSFDGAPSGTFQLSVSTPCLFDGEAVDMGTAVTVDESLTTGMNVVEAGAINAGDTVEGNIDSQVSLYTITLDAGQTVTITVSSDDFDTVVIVTNEERIELLGFNADGLDGANSELEFTAPSAGEFVILVGGFGGEATGSYTISVE